MGRSLSLAAYRVLSGRQRQASDTAPATRPKGELIWAHATTESRFSALCDLGDRLRSLRPDLAFLVTVEAGLFGPGPEQPERCDRVERLDSDHPASANEFLTRWAPDLCLWAGGDLMPNLISAASERDIPLILLDINETEFPSRRHKWFPDLTRSSLDCFDVIMTNGTAASNVLLRIGIATSKITVAAQLRNSALPPPCWEGEWSNMSQHLSGRPVWLAAHAHLVDFEPILTAHRAALRLSHRLLLVIHIADPADKSTLIAQLTAAGLRYADWDCGDYAEDQTQILISVEKDDLGLWYRVAPLTFMANSLQPDARGVSPLEAAALGSAVLYGPNVRNHLESYARLAAAGAARTVRDGEGLGAAVVQLIAPDHAAAMALAGWEVVSEGAELTDNLIDLIQDQLDTRRGPNART